MNILIVEDHEPSRKLLQVQLEAEGHSVFPSGDGVEALEILTRQVIHSIISDILMPRMDGYRFCYEVRKNEKWRGLPFIFYTATYTSPSDEKLALNVGGDVFLRKPASVQEITQALDKILADARPHEARPGQPIEEVDVLRQYNERLVGKLEQKTSELRVAHEELHQLLAHSPGVIYTLKLEAQAISPVVVSDNIERLLGVTPAEAAHYKWWLERLHPEDRERVLATVVQELERGGYSMEYRVRHKDGTYRWIEDTNRVMRDANGRPMEAVGLWTDITQRKQAEEQLLLQAAALETAANAIVITDRRGTIHWVNKAFTTLTGYSPKEAIGQNPRLLKSGKHDRALYQNLWQTILAGKTWRGEFTNRRKDGSLYYDEHIITPVCSQGGGITHFVAIMQDITARKQAEHRLATHHAATRALAESATLNEAANKILELICQNLQWDIGELWKFDRIARRLRCIEVWHRPSAEFREFVEVSRSATCAPGEGLPGRVWASGQPCWIPDVAVDPNFKRQASAAKVGVRGAFAFPIKAGDQLLGVAAFLSGQIREPDEDLIKMLSTLGAQIGQSLQRQQLEDQLRHAQKMEAIGQLAGGVAHDFNNMLVVLQGYPQILLSTKQLDAETVDGLKEMLLAADRASRLTRQLLAFSRKQTMHLATLSLNELVQNIHKMLQRVIGEDIALQCRLAPDPPLIQADPGMIEQVLMNLAVNARDAMPKGGDLMISTEKVSLDAGAASALIGARPGDFNCLSVADTGCGMAPEVLEHIFEPFFTTKESGKGTGLGLATVFGIVKQHEGWINVASQIGAGTTFRIYLPCVPTPAAMAADPQPAAEIRGGTETVLLVEDEVSVRRFAVRVLQKLGYHVFEAGSGLEALPIWTDHRDVIDLLVTDMVMPDGMTGPELADRLRTEKPALKVVYTSGYSIDFPERESVPGPASDFLQKPFSTEALAKTVRKRLDSKPGSGPFP